MLHWETWTCDHTCHTLQRRRRLISRRCQLAVTVEMFNVIQAHRRDLTRKDWLDVDGRSDYEPRVTNAATAHYSVVRIAIVDDSVR